MMSKRASSSKPTLPVLLIPTFEPLTPAALSLLTMSRSLQRTAGLPTTFASMADAVRAKANAIHALSSLPKPVLARAASKISGCFLDDELYDVVYAALMVISLLIFAWTWLVESL
jgi:hypothetical protein